MNIKKWFKRRQKSITMMDGETFFRKLAIETLLVGKIISDMNDSSFYFVIFLTENKTKTIYGENKNVLESERARLIEWVNSWL